MFRVFSVLLVLCKYSIQGIPDGLPRFQVSEGEFTYPKLITTFPVPDNTSCSLDAASFPDRIRTPLRPVLFGVLVRQLRYTSQQTKMYREKRSVEDSTVSVTVGSSSANFSVELSTLFPHTNSSPETTSYTSTRLETTTSTNADSAQTIVSNTPIPVPYKTLELVQLYDLDREKRSQYLLTIHCKNVSSGLEDTFPRLLIIEVTDIDDNTPKFVISSLTTVITSRVGLLDAVMNVTATDADTGINAELQYTSILGSERWKFPNSTKPVHATQPYFVMLGTGQVILLNSFDRDVVVTFTVVVKDKGSRADGNRATATATVSVFLDQQYLTTSSNSHTSNGSVKTWLIIVVTVGIAVLALLTTTFVVIWVRKKRSQQLTISSRDDELLVDSELTFIT